MSRGHNLQVVRLAIKKVKYLSKVSVFAEKSKHQDSANKKVPLIVIYHSSFSVLYIK